jgi:hypothetical protein
VVSNNRVYLLFSGDMDSVCSISATRYSVKDLNLPVTKPWRPWYTPDSEVSQCMSWLASRKSRFKFKRDFRFLEVNWVTAGCRLEAMFNSTREASRLHQ